MKRASATCRLVMALCALNMLFAQGLGLHFHRHSDADASGHPASLHLRDAGLHLHEHAGDVPAASEHSTHADEDLAVDPLGKGFAKFAKVWIGSPLQIIGIPGQRDSAWAPHQGLRQTARPHPELFVLCPPSHAPPLKPSLA